MAYDNLWLASCILSFGVVGLLLAWAWHKYVTDDPKDSPYVNEAELAHINEGRVEATGEKQIAPWGKLLRSTILGFGHSVPDYRLYHVRFPGMVADVPHGGAQILLS